MVLLPPGQQVPRHVLVVGRRFRFERQRMAGAFGGRGKASGTPSWVSPLMPSASISAISSATASGHGLPGIARSLVPHHHRKQHLDAAAVKIRHHLAHAGDAARHGADHVQLIAVVDAQIGIGGPDEHRIDAAIALLEIVQIAVHRVFAARRIVEVAILHHHLRLDEARSASICSAGRVISRAVIADIDSPLHPPVASEAKKPW